MFVMTQLLELGEANDDLPAFQIAGHLLACNRAKVALDLPEAHHRRELVGTLSRRYQLPQGMFVVGRD